MGLFDKLLSKLTGGTAPSPTTSPAAVVQPRTNTGITVTITGPASPSVQVSDAEVAERVREYDFVLERVIDL